MAWYEINYTCGHEGRVQLYGPGREREKRIEWMERGVCLDCLRAQKAEERKQDNTRAADLAGEIGFATLAGSDKQVAWANAIRQKAYEALIRRMHPHPVQGYALVVEAINLETSAKWWIDNRDRDAMEILNIIAAVHPVQAAEINSRGKETANG